ncbi:PREDICTED: methyltransferase-like protein 12, mitochondrial [Priapulus caudatus]|uniref:Methyltransferase-like protein 12, mitochondrial n=1 Tax=Priapulus caudatus TaxID=37621 RepID=A0ABM1EEB6_PRICU|nr:PREDICTED: methyltransferase-like protein 12, mitochondrial [Priapulus caudatus]
MHAWIVMLYQAYCKCVPADSRDLALRLADSYPCSRSAASTSPRGRSRYGGAAALSRTVPCGSAPQARAPGSQHGARERRLNSVAWVALACHQSCDAALPAYVRRGASTLLTGQREHPSSVCKDAWRRGTPRFVALRMFGDRCARVWTTWWQACIMFRSKDPGDAVPLLEGWGQPRDRLTYANLAEKPAWDTHYKRSPTSFDWLLSYDQMELALAPFLQGKVGQQVLDIGSGTSDLALRLATHYPCFVHCLDFSQGALAAAARTYRVAAAGGASSNSVAGALTFTAADAARLPYVDGCFHLVTDKGTSDSVLKDAGGGRALALRMFGECARVLTPGGSLLMFTDEDPEMRLPLLEDFAKTTRGGGASVRFSLLGERNGLEYFMYELRKS